MKNLFNAFHRWAQHILYGEEDCGLCYETKTAWEIVEGGGLCRGCISYIDGND